MVITIKSYEEFKTMWDNNTEYSGRGKKFPGSLLDRAKDSKTFRYLRDYLKEIEDEGIDIWYYCSDNSVNGKDLIFLSHIDDDYYLMIIHGILDDIYNGDKPTKRVYDTWAGGDPSSSASCCPYFE